MFQRNLTRGGRIVRGVLALALLAGAIFATQLHWGGRVGLLVAAAFVGFEALRGWCALRACGIKTKI
jgi:hypothetical protein